MNDEKMKQHIKNFQGSIYMCVLIAFIVLVFAFFMPNPPLTRLTFFSLAIIMGVITMKSQLECNYLKSEAGLAHIEATYREANNVDFIFF